MGDTIKQVHWQCQSPVLGGWFKAPMVSPCGVHEITEPLVYDVRLKWKPDSTGYGRVRRKLMRREMEEMRDE